MQQITNSFKNFLRKKYPFPVRKLPIHSRLGCPHRDGATGGCIYCYNPGFSNIDNSEADILTQFTNGIANNRNRGFSGKFIAYFQTDTNTYGEIEYLESCWKMIYKFPNEIMGISISTRPDCLSSEILQLLSDIGRTHMVWLELGLQSAHDRTLSLINRGHSYATFVDAVTATQQYPHILICAHLILGLPDETLADMKHTIKEINRLKPDGVKLHHLQVIKNTVLADWYNAGRFKVFTETEYIRVLMEIIPLLSPEIIIHRLLGDIHDDLLVAPRWKILKPNMIQMFYKQMEQQNLRQGIFHHQHE